MSIIITTMMVAQYFEIVTHVCFTLLEFLFTPIPAATTSCAFFKHAENRNLYTFHFKNQELERGEDLRYI